MGFNSLIVGRLCANRFYMPRKAVTCVLAMVAMVSACGQKGSLYLPTEAAALGRATLPQSVLPASGASAARPSAPASVAR